MEKSYKKVLIDEITNFKKENKLTYRAMADLAHVDHSYIYKIINKNNLVNDDILLSIINNLNIDLNCDKKMVVEFENDFSDLFYQLVSKSKEAKRKFETIETKKDAYLNSVCKHRFKLAVLLNYSLTDNDYSFDDLDLPNKDLLGFEDKRIYELCLGLYYSRKEDDEKALEHFEMDLSLKRETLVNCLTAYLAGQILAKKQSFYYARRYLEFSLDVFKKLNIENMVIECKASLGDLSYMSNENIRAIEIYQEIIENYQNVPTRIITNIFWCYLKEGRTSEIEELINLIDKDSNGEFEYEIYFLILYYAFIIDDKNLFVHWYSKTDKRSDVIEVQYDMIQIFKMVMDKAPATTIINGTKKTLMKVNRDKEREKYYALREIIIKCLIETRQYEEAINCLLNYKQEEKTLLGKASILNR